MINYLNLSGRSNVIGYDEGPCHLSVFFPHSMVYTYSVNTVGISNLEYMKSCAKSGRGLGTFISTKGSPANKGYETKGFSYNSKKLNWKQISWNDLQYFSYNFGTIFFLLKYEYRNKCLYYDNQNFQKAREEIIKQILMINDNKTENVCVYYQNEVAHQSVQNYFDLLIYDRKTYCSSYMIYNLPWINW